MPLYTKYTQYKNERIIILGNNITIYTSKKVTTNIQEQQ